MTTFIFSPTPSRGWLNRMSQRDDAAVEALRNPRPQTFWDHIEISKEAREAGKRMRKAARPPLALKLPLAPKEQPR